MRGPQGALPDVWGHPTDPFGEQLGTAAPLPKAVPSLPQTSFQELRALKKDGAGKPIHLLVPVTSCSFTVPNLSRGRRGDFIMALFVRRIESRNPSEDWHRAHPFPKSSALCIHKSRVLSNFPSLHPTVS